MNLNNIDWIAIDWGTSNFRALLINKGKIIEEINSSDGIKDIDNNNFEEILHKNIKLLNKLNDQITIIACGMIGSKQGWFDVGYVKNINAKINNLIKIKTKNKNINFFIVKGLCQSNPHDVMRGEETQVLGYLSKYEKFSGYICLPGTHSKWIKISNGNIIEFKTFMTGEIYEIISKHSILKYSILEKKINLIKFKKSILISQNSKFNFFEKLFEIRSRNLLSNKNFYPKSEIFGYLIGSEIKPYLSKLKNSKVIIIGSKVNSILYQKAMNYLKIKNKVVNSTNITLSGLEIYYNILKKNGKK